MYIDELNSGYLYGELWRNDEPRSPRHCLVKPVFPASSGHTGSEHLSITNQNKITDQGETMNNVTTAIPSMGAILEADDQGLTATAVKTAMELEVFEAIAQGHHTAEAVARATHCNVRGMRILLDALCAKTLLEKSNDRYELTATSATYLVRGARGYCVPIYLAWLQARDHFTNFVRTGKATLDLMSPEAEDLWVSYVNPDRVRLPELLELVTKRWTSVGMIPLPVPNASILDIGAGSGFKSLALLQADSSARLMAVDSPKVLEVTREVAEMMGVSDRVTFQTGDVLTEVPAESFDVVLFGSLLHYFEPETNIQILQKVHRALRPNGRAIIYATLLDDERKTAHGLLSNVDVSNCAPHGQHYSMTEYANLLKAAGFKATEAFEPVIMLGLK